MSRSFIRSGSFTAWNQGSSLMSNTLPSRQRRPWATHGPHSPVSGDMGLSSASMAWTRA